VVDAPVPLAEPVAVLVGLLAVFIIVSGSIVWERGSALVGSEPAPAV
jgi:hypothetical protein